MKHTLNLRFAEVVKINDVAGSQDADGATMLSAVLEITAAADNEFLEAIGCDPRAVALKSKIEKMQVAKPAETMALDLYGYSRALDGDAEPSTHKSAEVSIKAGTVHAWTITKAADGVKARVKVRVKDRVSDLLRWFAEAGGWSWHGQIRMIAAQHRLDIDGAEDTQTPLPLTAEQEQAKTAANATPVAPAEPKAEAAPATKPQAANGKAAAGKTANGKPSKGKATKAKGSSAQPPPATTASAAGPSVVH